MTISDRLRLRAPAWLHWPRRTARLRFTALYGGLFLFSGAAWSPSPMSSLSGRPDTPSHNTHRSLTPAIRNSRYLSYQMPWRSSSTTRVSCHRLSIS